MRFLVDARLPPALARWLTAAGHPSEHVADVGLAGAPDPAVWERARTRAFRVRLVMRPAPRPRTAGLSGRCSEGVENARRSYDSGWCAKQMSKTAVAGLMRVAWETVGAGADRDADPCERRRGGLDRHGRP
ncbi:MAG: hypothetical protein EXR76_17270, partial [Myxococcales bacterium]|nr:hypothetical protein [Myxococcales bacterium]